MSRSPQTHPGGLDFKSNPSPIIDTSALINAHGCSRRRNCNVDLDSVRWDRPDLDWTSVAVSNQEFTRAAKSLPKTHDCRLVGPYTASQVDCRNAGPNPLSDVLVELHR